jgi:predicted TIM-barrel fold metal-dependent hydrolase
MESISSTPVIDACAFHDWVSKAELLPYVGKGWRDLLAIENVQVKGQWQNQSPTDRAEPAATPPGGGPPASDPGYLIQQLLDGRGCERVVLGHEQGLLSAGLPMAYKSRAVVRALNDWTIAEWLERDERLYGHLLVQSGLPEEAAHEIRRVGEHEKFVAVALGPNGLNQPFGHPAYMPIYDAAVELGLPVVLQVGADNIADLGTTPTAIGLSATYAEYDAMSAAPLMSHLTSMFTSGIFDIHPSLRVLLVGGGLAWVPQFLWRLDPIYRVVRRVDMPWSKRLPSEYFAEHVRLSTYSLEAPPKKEQLESVLNLIPEVESLLLYASGYPNADGETAAAIAERLPEALHQSVFRDNAEKFYRWGGTQPKSANAQVRRGDIVENEAATRAGGG